LAAENIPPFFCLFSVSWDFLPFGDVQYGLVECLWLDEAHDFASQVAPFWKHVVTGRSDNIGVSRLVSALHETQPALDDWNGGEYEGASLKQLALHAFNNYFELKMLMERVARENEVELTADYPVYLASYLRFHNFAWHQDRLSGDLDGATDNSESPS